MTAGLDGESDNRQREGERDCGGGGHPPFVAVCACVMFLFKLKLGFFLNSKFQKFRAEEVMGIYVDAMGLAGVFGERTEIHALSRLLNATIRHSLPLSYFFFEILTSKN